MPQSTEIYEIIACLAGLETSLFVPAAGDASPGSGLKLDPRYQIHPSERDILDKLASLASTHSTIRHDLSLTKNSTSVIVRAISTEIEQHLESFLDFVVDFESLVLEKSPDLVFKNEVSLTRMLAMFMPYFKTMNHLSVVSRDLRNTNEAPAALSIRSLLESLRKHSTTGFAVLRPITEGLLFAAEKAWLQQVKTWSIYGNLLSDNESDFFVSWKPELKAYVYEPSKLLAHIDAQTGQDIFDLGLLLQDLHKDLPLYSRSSPETAMVSIHEELFDSILKPTEADNIRSVIEVINQSISKNVLKLVLPKKTIKDALQLLKDYYLLQNGEFAQLLVERAQEDFRSQKDQGYGRLQSSNVNAVLSRTLSTLSFLTDMEREQKKGSTTVQPFDLRMSIKESDTDDDKTGGTKSDFSDLLFGVAVELGWDIGWPLSIFLSVGDLNQYMGFFDFLIALRRSQQLVHNLWRDRRQELKHSTVSRATWIAAFRTIYFLESLTSHFHDQIENQYSRVLQNMVDIDDKIYSPRALSEVHRAAMKSLSRGLFEDNLPFRKTIRRLLLQIDVVLACIKNRETERIKGACLILENLVLDATASLAAEPGVEILLLNMHSAPAEG